MSAVRARFEDFGDFRSALGKLKGSQWKYKAFGPTDLREIEDLMPEKASRVRGWATGAVLFGIALYWIMAVETSLIYGIYVGGKPPISNVPYVVLAFEGAIFIGAITALVSIFASARLGIRRPPEDRDERFDTDSYGVEVHCNPDELRDLADLLKEAGAVEVRKHGTFF